MSSNEIQQICVGGVVKNVISYASLYSLIPDLTEFQYASILMNDFGYDKVPKDNTWLKNLEPFENLKKEIPIQLPVTNIQVTFNRDEDNLFNVLSVLRNIGRDKDETGTLLDDTRSWVMPGKDDLKRCVDKHLKIKLENRDMEKVYTWSSSDIFNRRLHNISPKINKDYYENCIRGFNYAAQYVKLKKPYVLFAAGIINPDIVSSMIRDTEIAACRKQNMEHGGQAAFRKDAEVIPVFADLFGHRYDLLVKQVKKNGLSSIGTMVRTVPIVDPGQMKVSESEFTPGDPFIGKDAKARRDYVHNYKIGNDEIDFVRKYVDLKTMPEYLVGTHMVANDAGVMTPTTGNQYMEVIKRVLVTLTRAKVYHPDLLNVNDKWEFSKEFFNNVNFFSLYKKSENKFLTIHPDMNYIVDSPENTILDYANTSGQQILLDEDNLAPEASENEAPPAKEAIIPEDTNAESTFTEPEVKPGDKPQVTATSEPVK